MEQNRQRDEKIEINFRQIFSLLISKAGLIIFSGIICALLALVVTKIFITPQYQSVTKMYVLSKQNDETLTNSDLQTSTLLTKDYAELVQSRTVTEAVIANLGLKIKHEDLIRKMEVSNTSDTRVITIKVKDADPYIAKELADEIRNTAAAHIKTVMNIEAVNVVDEANIPENKCSPSTMKNSLFAGLLGCILAIGIIIVSHMTNDTIKTSEDIERYLKISVLGTIPLIKEQNKKKRNHHRRR